MPWKKALGKGKDRGSLPACLELVNGNSAVVAKRLTNLVNIPNVVISPDDVWMPKGKPVQDSSGQWDKTPTKEARLTKSDRLVPGVISEQLRDWWLAVSNGANTPNWDIASTCKVEGRKGLLLVEAKAHEAELKGAEDGKSKGGNQTNHNLIGQCIEEANQGLSKETNKDWSLSRDSHYQMSNRFAWAWKLTELGYPVVLVYLGFLNANEMKDRGNPFKTLSDWEQLVFAHSKLLFPNDVWGKEWVVNGHPLIPLVKVY